MPPRSASALAPWVYYVVGCSIALGTILFFNGFARIGIELPGRTALLFVALVSAAYLCGLRAGMAAAAVITGYWLVQSGSGPMQVGAAVVTGACAVAIVWLVGRLERAALDEPEPQTAPVDEDGEEPGLR